MSKYKFHPNEIFEKKKYSLFPNNESENTIHHAGVLKQGHNKKIFLFNIIISKKQLNVKILVFTKIQKPNNNLIFKCG